MPSSLPRRHGYLHVPTGTLRNVLRNHLVLPLLATSLASAILIGARGDFLLADLLYAAQGHTWALRESWITTTVVHEAGKTVSAAAWLGVLLAWLWSLFDKRLTRWRRPLGYLAWATLAGAVTVSLLKAGSGMDCPWDLQRYGGLQPFVGLFDARPPSMGRAACFPAGHASAGYAWVTLYFFFCAVRPRWRWAGLAVALGVGALFGISQQLRGAHFLSHDLWTLIICWLVALGGSTWLLRPNGKGASG
ncbi:phosphatase PAP2 family protein [Lysobacter sp. H21R4]|uniref:phosphatase PAP2 family protein n=1 Tax=Lysobacter sp. H21R4 TaxID=2781021 RepID=UPI0018884700|nr:phosphatase PAP2 family protein [Lysobacter sp. H21R4]QOY61675.1 phosphatase PAP2 family protein [Lysobacter sp. H21R4]